MRFIVAIFLISNCVWSQNLDKHQWQERIILITSGEKNIKNSTQQLELFLKHKDELIDRKIVLYKCGKNQCTFYNRKLSLIHI